MTTSRFALSIPIRLLGVPSALCLCLLLSACDAVEEDLRELSPPGGTATVSFNGNGAEVNAYYTIEHALDDPDGEGGRLAFLFVQGSAEGYTWLQPSIILRHEALSTPQERVWGIRDFDDTTEYFYGDVYTSASTTYRAKLGVLRITEIEGEEVSGVFSFVYGPDGASRVEASFTAVPYQPDED